MQHDLTSDVQLLTRVVGDVVREAKFEPLGFAYCEQKMVSIHGAHRDVVLAVTERLSDDDLRAIARLSSKDYESVMVNAWMAIYGTLAAMVEEAASRKSDSLHH